MSLLNKMLVDLEARQRAAKEATHDGALEDTHPVSRETTSPRRILILVAVGVLVAAAYLLARYPRHHAAARAVPAAQVAQVAPQVLARPAPATPTPLPPAVPSEALPVPPQGQIAAHSGAAAQAIPVRKAAAPRPRHAWASSGARHASRVRVAEPATGLVSRVAVPLSPAQRSQQYYRDASTALEQGVAAKARSDLRSSLAADPLNLPARELLAGLELQRGRDQAAAALLEEGLRLAPQDARFALLLANVYVGQRQGRQALAVLRSHHSAGAHDPRYLEFLAALEEQAHDLSAAAADYRAALALAPHVGASWAGLGMAIEATDPSKAVDAYHQALLDPTLPAPLAQYVRTELRRLEAR